MKTYQLVYKLPDTTELIISVTGNSFLEGWVNEGRSLSDFDAIMKKFPPRKEADDKVKSKIDKYLFIFYVNEENLETK